MRTLSAQDTAVVSLSERSTRIRVQIDRTGSGGWVDLSDYEGRNWIERVEYEDNADKPVGSVTVRLNREWHDLSLSPAMAASKLNTGGFLVFPKRKIKVEAAVMPRGTDPASGDWIEVFSGKIDRIDWEQSPMAIKARDDGGDLQDGWVETQKVYGTAGGRAIESVMQDILDDADTNNWIAGTVTLYSENGTGGTPFNPSDTPGFFVFEYQQGREPLMDALQKLARQIGWECRYRWNSDTSAFQLTLYEPARAVRSRGTITVSGDPSDSETFFVHADTYTAKTSGAGTDEFNIVVGDTAATAANITAMLNAGSSNANINAFTNGSTVIVEWQTPGVAGDSITFTESMSNVTMDGGGTLGGTRGGLDASTVHTFDSDGYYDVGQLNVDVKDVRNFFSGTFETTANERTTVTRKNDASITKYGRRPFLLTEDADHNINTVAEMIDLLDAADNDLSEPDIGQGVLVPYFPWGEAGDYYKFEANGIHYDSDQNLAAVSLRHVLTPTEARTMITARGKPALGPTRWLEAEGRPGIGPPPDILAPDAATGVSAVAAVGGWDIVYDDPRTMTPPILDWVTTKCYVDTNSGFTPGPAFLVAQGKQTRFQINGLVPGTTYYAKLEIIDGTGNVGAISAQVSVATERIGPYHENTDGQQDQLLRNNDFNIFTKGTTSPPDFWTMVTGAWDTDINETLSGITGDHALEFSVNGAEPAIESGFMPLSGGGSGLSDLYQAAIVCSRTGGDPAKALCELEVRYYNISKVYQSSDTTQFALSSSSTQQYQTATLEPPSAARFAKLRIKGTYSSSTTYTMVVDRCSLLRAYALGRVAGIALGSINPFSTTIRTLEWDETFHADDIGMGYADDYGSGSWKDAMEIKYPGVYIIAGEFFANSGNGGPFWAEFQIEVNDGTGYVVIAQNRKDSTAVSGSDLCILSVMAPPQRLEVGDKIRVRYITSIGPGINDFVDVNGSFSARQIVRDVQ